MPLRRRLRLCAVLVAATTLCACATAPVSAPRNWTFDAVAATKRWPDFVTKLTVIQARRVTPALLEKRCRDELAVRPVPLEDDGVGACVEASLRSLDDHSSYLGPAAYVAWVAEGKRHRPNQDMRVSDGSSVQGRMLTDGVAYVRLKWLGFETGVDLLKQLLALKEPSGRRPSALVLDLRGNPGGLLDELGSIGWVFVPEGAPVVSFHGWPEDRTVKSISPQRWLARDSLPSLHELELPPWTREARLIVLMDHKTSAGAEALAQFLKEARQARLLGQPSAGATAVRVFVDLAREAGINVVSGGIRSAALVDWSAGLEPDVPLEQEVPPQDYGGPGDAWVQRALAELTAPLRPVSR